MKRILDTASSNSGDAILIQYHSTIKGHEAKHDVYVYGCKTFDEAKDKFYSELPPGMSVDSIIIDDIRFINKIPSKKNNPKRK